jgi:hypothetical protein
MSGAPESSPSSFAVSVVTTEHLTLQSARAQTVAESTGRATMFLGAVSAGLVALSLMATAARLGTAFFAFALIVLPTLAAIGFATVGRALQTGIEDYRYARRIARLRAYYLDNAPELVGYLARAPTEKRLDILELHGGRSQTLRTVAGMLAVVASVIAGSAVGLVVTLLTWRLVFLGYASGIGAATIALSVSLYFQRSAWLAVEREDA